MINCKNKIRAIYIASLSLAAISCSSSDDGPSTNIVLGIPLADRQISAFENSVLRADIIVNNGAVQSFTVAPGQQVLDAGIRGVNINQSNDISIKWTEILNGFEVELTDQTQSFFADGNTQITAPHVADQYDYDSDGDSNLTERSDGMCVWTADELCLTSGQADIPSDQTPTSVTGNASTVPVPTPVAPQSVGDNSGNGITALEATVDTTPPIPTFQFNFGNATDIAMNGDFSQGTIGWDTNVGVTLIGNGDDLCGVMSPSDIQLFRNVYFWTGLFELIDGKYLFSFDIRSDRESIVKFGMVSDDIAWFDHPISVSAAEKTVEISYEHRDGSFINTGFAFLAIPHPNVNTTYCIDNFRWLVEN